MCGAPSVNSRCGAHVVQRLKPSRPEYANTAWRKLSRAMRAKQPWCSICFTNKDLTLDHLVPLAKGGAVVPDANGVVVLCRSCNSRRGARLGMQAF